MAVLRADTNQPKIDMGPALIHYRKVFSTYHYFASSLVSINQEMSELKCFGTDGETALSDAFAKTFPLSDQLRCFIHSRKNVEQKLTDFGLSSCKSTIVEDIFGKTEGTHRYDGLVHATDKDTFDALVESLKDKWDNLEFPFLPRMIAMPRFHKWFVDNIAGYMKSTMIENVRARNGIDGSFTTNQSESLNAELRRKVNYQTNELPDFLELMRQFYKSQESENQSAFVGEGDFLISDLFSKFQAGESYYNMSISERTAFEKRFYNSSPADSQKESLFDEITIPGLDADHSRNIVSKAERILEMDGVVPFSSSGSFHVINSEGSRPHYVVQNKDGSFTCDNRNLRNGCIGFNASNVCSHTYAAAKFSRKLQSFFKALERKESKASGNNLTNISHYGISEGAGKKAGAVRKRKQTQEIATTSPMLVNQSLKLRVIKHNGNHVAVPTTGKDYTKSKLFVRVQVVPILLQDSRTRMHSPRPTILQSATKKTLFGETKLRELCDNLINYRIAITMSIRFVSAKAVSRTKTSHLKTWIFPQST
eukprot:TCONS_00063739-protein